MEAEKHQRMPTAWWHTQGAGLAALLTLTVLAAACTEASQSGNADTATTGAATGDELVGSSPTLPAECGEPTPRRQVDGPSAEAIVLSEGGGGEPRVEAYVYPHPDYEGDPWSQWGQGLVLPDGRFLSAIGDHLGTDGNSYLYEYDPETSELTLVSDILSLVEHESGEWGYGKVHGQIVSGPCGEAYVPTYWGTRRGLEYKGSYQGDLLIRWDPNPHEFTVLGVPILEHGIPSLAGWSEGGLLYGEAVEPEPDPKVGVFFAYDVARDEVVFETDAREPGFRNILVDGAGHAHFAAGDAELSRYDPETGDVETLEADLPGEWLRASTAPDVDGTVYGATRDPDALFALEPSGEIRPLGEARGYVASMAFDTRRNRVLYVPEAHGASWEQGTPIISVNPETGAEEVLLELNDMAEEELGLRLGGTYNIVYDPSGDRVYVGLNAGEAGEESFREVVLVVVDLR